MDVCRLQYLAGVALTSLLLKLTTEVGWPPFVVWLALMLLLEQYDLVPRALACPPALVYPVYKVLAAALIAFIGTFTVFTVVQDFIKWALESADALFERVPGVNRKLGFGEDANVLYAVEAVVAAMALLWVLLSFGFHRKIFRSGPSAAPPCAPMARPQSRGRSRRRSRC